jgi:hypothetical protein
VKISLESATPEDVAAVCRKFFGDGPFNVNIEPRDEALPTPEAGQFSDAEKNALAYLRGKQPGWVAMADLANEMGYRRQHATWVCGQIFKKAPHTVQRRTREGLYEYKAR